MIEMPIERVLATLRSDIEQRRDDKTVEIAKGGCKDFAQYQHQCGVIRGLNDALVSIDALAKSMEESE